MGSARPRSPQLQATRVRPRGRARPPLYPPGEELRPGYAGGPLSAYSGTVAIRVPAEGSGLLPIEVEYQPCHGSGCLEPRTAVLRVPLR